MSYFEETHVVTCGSCGKVNHVVVAYAGDSRANERETEDCWNCGAQVYSEKCFAIYGGETPEAAILSLRKMQGRA
jgi:hypothetical protein